MDTQNAPPLRRSPVQDRIAQDGAVAFQPWRGGHVVGSVADRNLGQVGVRGLWLFDASPVERHRYLMPGAPKRKTALARGRALRGEDGWLALRAGPADYSLLPPFSRDVRPAPALPLAWRQATAEPGLQQGGWFYVLGDATAQLFAQGCEVDMRPSRFDDGAVLQMMLFRASVTVVREDTATGVGYHILCCNSLAHHLYGKIGALQATHGGGLLGLDDLAPPRRTEAA